MKKNRKLTALLVAACMTIPMAATTFTVPMMASAEGETVITLSEDNSSLQAYQIFKGTYSDGKLGVSGWGDAFIEGGQAGITTNMILSFLNALSAYEPLKENGTSIFASAWSDSDMQSALNSDASKVAQDIADILASEDGKYAVPFARFTADYISNNNQMKSNISGTKNDNMVSGLKDGYYIFADPEDPTLGTWSLGMLKVIDDQMGGVSVGEKRSQSSVTKLVSSDNDPYADQTDAEIGETVHFRIECTLPTDDELDYFTAYYLEINDTLGTAFDNPKNVALKYGADASNTTSIAENIANATNTDTCFYSYSNNTITVKMEDVKSYAGNKIYLEYDAVLNSSAEPGNKPFTEGEKQKNSVQIKYSNNPNYVWVPITDNATDTIGDDHVSTSVADSVKVFTYQLVVNKVDGNNNNKLEGVTFRLKRNSTNEYVTIDNNNKVTGWSNTEDNTTLLTTDANGQIKIIGLDDNGDANEYTLIEVTPLPGYNTVADLPINIVPTFENQELKTLLPNDTSVADNIADGIANVEIVNKQGATLPETGGIGTKIFYILGGTLVIGSGAALVIKKRMGKDEE